MSNVVELWKEALPEIRDGVTGVGVWTALNACKPIVLEDGTLVLGLGHDDSELIGHLRLPRTLQVIETVIGRELKAKVSLRVISGVDQEDWENEKRGDIEREKLQASTHKRVAAETAARKTWDGLYEQLGKRFNEMSNRTLPQTRARYFLDAVEILADALIETPVADELEERSFARCIERVSQYSEMPSTLVALKVLEKAFDR